jgi:PAS domain S-box-containing protein
LVAEINLTYLAGLEPLNTLPPMTDMALLDGRGRLLISSLPSPASLANEYRLQSSPSFLHQFTWRDGGREYQADAHHLFLKTRFGTPEWTVILSQSREHILESVADFKALFPLVALLALFIAFYLSIVFARRSLIPIEKLRQGTANILKGKFNDRLEFDSGDEFEELAESFNHMSEKLGRQLRELRLNAEIGRLTARISSPPMLCRSILRAMVRYMDYATGVMYIRRGSEGRLEAVAHYGRNKEDIHHLVTHCARIAGTGPEGFPEPLFQAKKIAVTGRNLNDTSGEPAEGLQKQKTAPRRLVIHAPVIYEDSPIGLLVIERDGTEARLPEAERNFVRSVASHLALSLANIDSFHKMQQSEERFRKTFSHAASGIALIKPGGELVTVNDALSKMLGCSAGDLQEKTIQSVSHPPDVESESAAFERLMRGEVESEVYEKRFVHRKGHMVWGLVSATLIRDHRQRPLHYVYHVQDLSDLKKAQENQIALKMQLQQTQKIEALGTLAGGIAHDFNNILFGLIGYAELGILESQNSPEARSRFKDIIAAAERAADLIRQILAFSRKNEKNLQTVQVSSLVKESLKLLRASMPSNIEIKHRISAQNARVIADPTQIHQIILNLCTNALHAMMEDGGTLSVQLALERLERGCTHPTGQLKAGRYLKISVSDTGCGIKPEHLERIFEPYFTTKKSGQGTGLGLSVVHGIVKEHGGDITVRSAPGKGTTFDVYFPESRPDPAGCEAAEGTLQKGCECILLVDDEKEIAEVFKKALEKLGYRVEGMTDPTEALASFQRQPEKYDVVITDMTMPKLTGDRLAEEMMAIRPGVPIILCTGFNELISAERAYEMGIKKFVLKPWSLHKMSHAVRSVLDGTPAADRVRMGA